MKKIATVLVMIVFSLLCFTACGNLSVAGTSLQDEDPQVIVNDDEKNDDVGTVTETEEFLSLNFDGAGDVLTVIDGIRYKNFGTIEFGEYPQTVAEKKALKEMSETTDHNTGYYLSTYDDEHYAKVTIANTYGPKYVFESEKEITNRETYYFKVEPIRWQVFGQFDVSGTNLLRIYLVSERILDSSAFLADSKYYENSADIKYYNTEHNAYANDWRYSDLRTWLNGAFLRQAFTEAEKAKLVEKSAGEVEQSDKSLKEEFDKVFLLSYEQATLLADPLATVSDYARCRGTWMSIYADFLGKGRWWTNTPGDLSYRVCYGGTDNKVKVSNQGESAGASYMGVRPAIMIDVEDLGSLLVKDDEESK